ncbi:MAG: universal stress protein [Rhodobacteraceae bacterium]|nr:universal stress protein [Paracoccaceae bacterium]
MRKFLVILDSTTECLNAMRFAALRASHTGGGVVILAVIPPEEFNHWIGVADIMREEARERIEAHFKVFSERMQKEEGISPELVIREGKVEAEIIDYIQDEPDVGVLVLGAGTGKEGPGPLINYVLRHSGTLPIPVTVVPGAMSKEAIKAVA